MLQISVSLCEDHTFSCSIQLQRKTASDPEVLMNDITVKFEANLIPRFCSSIYSMSF